MERRAQLAEASRDLGGCWECLLAGDQAGQGRQQAIDLVVVDDEAGEVARGAVGDAPFEGFGLDHGASEAFPVVHCHNGSLPPFEAGS